MYTTSGVNAIATVTELRSKTTNIIDNAKKSTTGIMIQKNNTPEAVMVSYDLYQKMYKAYTK
jgi:prevent-host-death family protein